MHKLVTCLLVLGACSSGRVEPSPVQQTPPVAVVLESTKAQIKEDASVLPPVVAPATRECREACGRMLEEPYAAVAESVKQECSIDWKDASDASDACEGWDLLRNCVYAAGGKKFRTLHWREQFRDYSWYQPNAAFKHMDLSKVAKSNIKKIKGYKDKCEETASAKPGALVKEMAVDLDGDGKAETIRVTTTRVFVDGHDFAHDLKPYAPQDMSVSVLDVDTSDAYKEVMISMYYYEQNASQTHPLQACQRSRTLRAIHMARHQCEV